MFWQNKYLKLTDAICRDVMESKTRIMNLEMDLEKLKSHIISLRGTINRSKGKSFEEEEEEQTEKNKNPQVFLNPNGHPLGSNKFSK